MGLGERHPEADGVCPTGCGRTVQLGHLMCGPCWHEVPWYLQRQVLAKWRAYSAATRARADGIPEKRAAYEAARATAIWSIR